MSRSGALIGPEVHSSLPLVASMPRTEPSLKMENSRPPILAIPGAANPFGPTWLCQIALPLGSIAHTMPPESTPYIVPSAVSMGDENSADDCPVAITFQLTLPVIASSWHQPPTRPPTYTF